MEYAQLIRTIMRNWTICTTLVCFNLFLFANLTLMIATDHRHPYHLLQLQYLLLLLLLAVYLYSTSSAICPRFVFAFCQISYLTKLWRIRSLVRPSRKTTDSNGGWLHQANRKTRSSLSVVSVGF